MTVANTPFYPPQKVQDALVHYEQQTYSLLGQQWNMRERMRQVDLSYIRENDFTQENFRARIANSYGDANKFQNITIPVVMPQVESAVTYQSSVFLQGNPIFGVAAPPQYIDAAVQMETLIENQQIAFGWVRELMMFLRDGFKYNISGVEVNWDTYSNAELTTDLQFATNQAKPKNIVQYGNRLRRLDPYNMFFDSRVAPSRVYCEGEFIGWTEIMSRIRLKQFINDLPVKINVTKAFESGLGGGGGYESYYIPQINPYALMDVDPRKTTNWLAWANLAQNSTNAGIDYKDIYEVTTLYAKLLPSDFDMRIPEANTPQIFKLIIVNHSVPIYIERQTNAHNWLPVLIGQPNEDGLNFQTKSLANNAEPFQAVTSAMMNSVIAARRRAISDRTIYDPSRIAEHHINSDNPSAKIPVRPSAYGKPVGESVYPFPFRDDQSGVLLQEISTILALGNEANGQNKAKQGQFVKGNKTQREFDTVMGNANGRDQMTAMLLESQVFTPMKHMIKINILQYQGADTVFSTTKNMDVKISPDVLRKAVMDFKISDGLLPTDKLMSADAFTTALQTIGTSQQIGSAYNIGPMFSYLMKQQGADLSPFEKSAEQQAYEQAVMAWQQAVVEAIKAGATPDKLPPQPTPEQFNYVPGQLQAAPPNNVQPKVNNITNNITNNEAQ